ncbi:MAG TPA: hypothetical protein VGI59_05845, partial [Candidatus Udaeobacter sp.]
HFRRGRRIKTCARVSSLRTASAPQPGVSSENRVVALFVTSAQSVVSRKISSLFPNFAPKTLEKASEKKKNYENKTDNNEIYYNQNSLEHPASGNAGNAAGRTGMWADPLEL